MTDIVHLRGHHLLCILTYMGRGYTPHFVVRMDDAVRRIAAGADVELVDGPDDLCAALLEEGSCQGEHCTTARVERRDSLARGDVAAFIGRPVATGTRLTFTPDLVARLRRAFAEGTIRSACGGCEWKSLCDGLAETGFAGTRLP